MKQFWNVHKIFGEGREQDWRLWWGFDRKFGWMDGGEKYCVLGGCGLWVLQHLFDCAK